MKVKKFQARDMAEAMRMVKMELGPNAIILHSRDLGRGLLGWFSRGGVEVTAGVDLKKPAAKTPSPPPKRGNRLDIKVEDSPGPYDNELPSLLSSETRIPPPTSSIPRNPQPPVSSPETPLDENPLLTLSKKIVEGKKNGNGNGYNKPMLNALSRPPEPAPNPAPKPETEKFLEDRLTNLENRLIKLTGLIENLAPVLVSGDMPSVPSHTRQIYNHLLEQDVDEHLALTIASHIAETTDEQDDVWTALKTYLISQIPVAEPVQLNTDKNKPKVLMLVGPTGVGKTTTLAKISAEYRYNPETKTRPKIVFITADLYRLAAVEQLQKYTEILGVELEVTYSAEEVRQSLQKHKDAHLILFDTAGTCQRNMPQMSTLGTIVDACHQVCASTEVHLVISSTTKYSDMIDIVEHFKEIKPIRLLFTKIDESTTFGPILNTVIKYKMPVSYLTTGQNVPEDIERARPERIAKLLLSKPVVNRSMQTVSSTTNDTKDFKEEKMDSASPAAPLDAPVNDQMKRMKPE